MLQAFTRHNGVAAPLMIDNVDTDQIIPSREMKTVGRAGLGEGLFAGWRYTAPGSRELNGDFVLNQPAYTDASILVAGHNFGCGSSREHAVWALAEYGVRAIIAKSFGEIFYGNCTRNGIVPIKLAEGDVEALAKLASRDNAPRFEIDLPQQRLSVGGTDYAFDIGAYAKRLLVEGLDPIGLTLQQRGIIEAFQKADAAKRPWVYSAA